MSEKITPMCRYGHGALKRFDFAEGEPQAFKVDTFPYRPAPGSPGQWLIYSFYIYKCPVCSYLELHDEP